MSADVSLLQRMLVGYLANAKALLDDESYQRVYPLLPGYLAVANEMATIEVLADRPIMCHAIDSLAAGNSVEETLMYTFMFDILRLVQSGTRHPLEMGIIRQRIIGLLPVFAKACDKGQIRPEVFESNAAMMMSIADKTDEMHATLATLEAGYARYTGQA